MPTIKENLNRIYGKSSILNLPLTWEDFESDIDRKNYLLNLPMVNVFLNEEVRTLENIDFLSDGDAQNALKNGFKKLEKLPYLKWVKMNDG